MSDLDNRRAEIATRLLAGLLANPGGPVQRRADTGWGFINCAPAEVAEAAVALADDLIAALAASEGRAVKASEVTMCHACGKHPLQSGVTGAPSITFFRLTSERFMLDQRAAQQLVGLDAYFGGGHPLLAEVFTPQPDVYVTNPGLKDTLIVCDSCAAEYPIFELLRMASDRKERDHA